MRLFFNYCFLLVLKIANKLGRGFILKKNTFSSIKILENNFPKNQEFNFIQIGANDGVSFDSLYEFVIFRKSSGIVVEPVVTYFNELVKNYKDFPDIIKINKAIHPTEKRINIYKIDRKKVHKYPDWVKGIASLDKNHHKKTNIKSEDIIIEQVQADNLMSIINKHYKYSILDYIQIDVEGFDFEIVKMIDFDKIKPLILKCEIVNLTKEDKSFLRLYLEEKGYFIFTEEGDVIGIDLKKIKLYQ